MQLGQFNASSAGCTGDAQSSNVPRDPLHDGHKLRVVEKEVEPDSQRDHPEKQLSHMGYLPIRNISAKTSELVALSRMAYPTRMEG